MDRLGGLPGHHLISESNGTFRFRNFDMTFNRSFMALLTLPKCISVEDRTGQNFCSMKGIVMFKKLPPPCPTSKTMPRCGRPSHRVDAVVFHQLAAEAGKAVR
jgi:hypothetical protein